MTDINRKGQYKLDKLQYLKQIIQILACFTSCMFLLFDCYLLLMWAISKYNLFNLIRAVFLEEREFSTCTVLMRNYLHLHWLVVYWSLGQLCLVLCRSLFLCLVTLCGQNSRWPPKIIQVNSLNRWAYSQILTLNPACRDILILSFQLQSFICFFFMPSEF